MKLYKLKRNHRGTYQFYQEDIIYPEDAHISGAVPLRFILRDHPQDWEEVKFKYGK